MKKITSYVAGGLCVMSLTFSAGAVVKAQAATNAVEQAGQPVDLTYASKKALAAVVSIKTVQNSKTKVVEMNSDPFGDFFSDPFGFFGNPGQGNGGKQKRQVRTPKQEGLGSGVIISPDGYIVTNSFHFQKWSALCCPDFPLAPLSWHQRQAGALSYNIIIIYICV